MEKQRALIIIKPDAVKRGIIGEILQKFERVGLKIIALKLDWATKEQIKNHYPETEAWFKKVGERTLTNYQKRNLDPKKILGTDNAVEIGKLIKLWFAEYITESPILLAIMEGYEAVHLVRKLTGETIPLFAQPGTIRGDYSHDFVELANERKRPIRSVIHATDEVEESSREIGNWFSPEEIFDYTRVDEETILGKASPCKAKPALFLITLESFAKARKNPPMN